MKNKKAFVFILLAIVVVVSFVIYRQTPEMKMMHANENWHFKVTKDKNDSEQLQGVLTQKNEQNNMEIISLYINNTASHKRIVTYTNEDVKAGFTEENYKNEKNPIDVEFPLGNHLELGTAYTLLLNYKMNGKVKTDEIKFK